MKIINYILFATIALFALGSCDSNLDNLTVDSPATATASVLSVEGSTTVVPTSDNLTEYVTIFNWTRTLVGSTEIPVTYTLLVDTTDRFENPISLNVGTNGLTKAVTNSTLNDWGISLSVDPAAPVELNLFVKLAGSVLSENSSPVVALDSIYSNYVTMSVTPFLAEPAVIYIAGDFKVNGWNPALSPKLYSATRNNIYVGYIYLNTEYKVCPKPAWDGDMGGANGILSGGDNIKSTPGFYWMEVDLNKKTYKTTAVDISVIGNVYGNWDTDLVMTYDEENNVLKASATYTKGEFKFRQDASWGIQFGLDSDGNLAGKMSADDDDPSNIPLDTAGSYTITLDLWNYLEPTYSIDAN